MRYYRGEQMAALSRDSGGGHSKRVTTGSLTVTRLFLYAPLAPAAVPAGRTAPRAPLRAQPPRARPTCGLGPRCKPKHTSAPAKPANNPAEEACPGLIGRLGGRLARIKTRKPRQVVSERADTEGGSVPHGARALGMPNPVAGGPHR